MTYSTCTACFIGRHADCTGEARIYHVGGGVEVVRCLHERCVPAPSVESEGNNK